jgi:osmotically inducible lipoprotein OsmE
MRFFPRDTVPSIVPTMRSVSPSRPVLVLSLAASCLMSGCSWFDMFMPSLSYARMPVPMAASARGATRERVVDAGGNPRSVWMVRNGAGVCYNYVLERGERNRPYYVVFDRTGSVVRHGFDTCMDADRKGLLQMRNASAQ